MCDRCLYFLSGGGNVGILDTQESYDDVSGGELIEEDLYEELNN
jgi:hypothetical protein